MPYTYPKKKHVHMGLASALEEERLELAAEARAAATAAKRASTSSAYPPPHQQQPRHLFDDVPPSPGALPPRHGSIAGIGVGVTPPSHRPGHEPLRTTTSSPPSRSASPAPPAHTSHTRAASSSATTTSRGPPPILPKPPPSEDPVNGNEKPPEKPKPSIRWDSSVVMTPTSNAYNHARRSSQHNQHQERERERPSSKGSGKSAMAAVMSGLDLRVGLPSLPGFTRGRSSSRNSSKRGNSLDSRLPSVTRKARSSSPRTTRWDGPGPAAAVQPPPPSAPATPATEEKKTLDVEPATPTTKRPAPPSREPSEVEESKVAAPPEDGRLEKDVYDSENNLIESSDDDADESSSSDDDDDDSNSSPESEAEEAARGRKKDLETEMPVDTHLPSSDSGAKTDPDPDPEEPPKSDNSSATTEEPKEPELNHSSKQGPVPKKQPEVHPRTSFDSTSAANTPFGSEDEAEITDIKRAQKLSVQMSPINSAVHNRAIRTIIRGDYTNLPEETEAGRRRRRKYMVATDLSEESVYALEWTVGTILRDGDTMFAVFCAHEETGAQIGEGAKHMQDTAAVIGTQTAETAQKSQNNDSATNLSRSLLGRLGTGTDSKPGSVDGRGMTKAESERLRAVNIISETCVRLLRKTLLQVRVAVEVIHCKSPKHMLTEAIDGLEPTLVIVGARGRSALKGVLLGSFSNYLVMHSSVPVMVARKKLKKQSKNKKTKTNIRLSNNLPTPKKLAQAKVD